MHDNRDTQRQLNTQRTRAGAAGYHHVFAYKHTIQSFQLVDDGRVGGQAAVTVTDLIDRFGLLDTEQKQTLMLFSPLERFQNQHCSRSSTKSCTRVSASSHVASVTTAAIQCPTFIAAPDQSLKNLRNLSDKKSQGRSALSQGLIFRKVALCRQGIFIFVSRSGSV